MIKKLLVVLALTPWLLLCCVSFAAAAAEPEPKACLLEGTFMRDGQAQPLEDCLQNDGGPHEHLVQACEGAVQMSVAVGAPPPRVTWLPACPPRAQARCEGFGGTQLAANHYKRTADQLAQSRPGCEALGGAWIQGDGSD